MAMDEEQVRKAVEKLDAIPGNDPEFAHGEADETLLELVPEVVREAYNRVVGRCSWWMCA
jgi:hypothetical protein